MGLFGKQPQGQVLLADARRTQATCGRSGKLGAHVCDDQPGAERELAMRELFRTLTHRLAALFRRRRLEDDLDEELRSHLEMAVELNMRKGMTPEDARGEALRGFGGFEQTKEVYRDQRGLPMIETTLQDLRFGF